jgi:F0F1-type ATP synthase alpha subunit
MATKAPFKLKLNTFKLFASTGLVISVADGIVSFIGASEVAYNETVTILTSEGPIVALVLNIERNKVSAIVMDDDINIKPDNLL